MMRVCKWKESDWWCWGLYLESNPLFSLSWARVFGGNRYSLTTLLFGLALGPTVDDREGLVGLWFGFCLNWKRKQGQSLYCWNRSFFRRPLLDPQSGMAGKVF